LKNTNINTNLRLIAQCKKGNSAAQFELYKLYYKAMYNSCLRIVSAPNDAEDIMQEAFLSAFKHLDSWSEEVEFGAWLKKIVINKSLDYLKKRKLLQIEFNEKFLNLENEENETLDFELKIVQVKSSMELLPEKYRVVMLLYLFEGYDHNEISEIFNITASTSRSILTRGKDKLVEILKNHQQK